MRLIPRTIRGFTLVEVMVVVGVIAILVAVIITATAAAHKQSQVTRTRQTIAMLSEAVTAFKNATGYYPLAVPRDGCLAYHGRWSVFTGAMEWSAAGDPPNWNDYFRVATGMPVMSWEGATAFTNNSSDVVPTNNDFLIFQLEQVPQSNSILEQIRSAAPAETSRKFIPAGDVETWAEASELCQLGHPLDATGYRRVRQVQDAWGMPLRYWTGDIMKWAKRQGVIGIEDPWQDQVQRHLAEKLQAANWGFFIESAGPDEYFGWWGAQASTLNESQVADNIHSTDE